MIHSFATTIERAPVGIAHFDATGRFSFANAQLCTIFGLPYDVVLTKTFHEISFADDLPRCLALTRELAAGLIPRYTMEKRFTRPDGSLVYTRVIVTMVPAVGDEPTFFIGIVEDLSEQRENEEIRRAAEERLAVALEASGTGIYRYNFVTRALDWSNGLARLFGLSDTDQMFSLDRLLGTIVPEDRARVE